MPRAKVILFAHQGGLGWEEIFYHDYADPEFDDLRDPIQNLLNNRREISPPSVTFEYIRVSDDVIRGDSRLFTDMVPRQGRFTSGPAGNATSPAFVALLLRIESTTLYRRSLELRGLPAAYVTDPFLPTAISAITGGGIWLTNLANLGKTLAKNTPSNSQGQNWAIKAQTKAPGNPEYRVTNVALDVPNRRYILTTAPAPVTLAAGDKVRCLRLRQYPGLSGAKYVVAQAGATVTVQVFETPVDPGVEPRGLLQKEVMGSQLITATIPRRWAHRDTGRPFPSGAGRRPAR